MKKIFYIIYAFFFSLGRVLPQKENLVALVSPHNAGFHDSLGEIRAALEERGGYEILPVTGAALKGAEGIKGRVRFFLLDAPRLARAKYIFLNDNFMPLGFCPLRKSAVVTQLWHGEGALKKICLALHLPKEIEELERKLYKKYSYVVCSSPGVQQVNMEAYDMPRERVLPLGSPRTDAFFRPFDMQREREAFDREFPQCRGKKLVLYAPTFRDDPQANKDLPTHFDGEAFQQKFGERYALLVRFHPQMPSEGKIKGAIDLTGYPDIGKLQHLCDIIISDYSTVFMDFTLLGKPSIFYAFDKEAYAEKRELYGKYEDIVPGPIAETFEELLKLMEHPEPNAEKLQEFCRYHLGACDGKATQRVLQTVMHI